MKRLFAIPLAALALCLNLAHAEADKYRVIWNKSPESCTTIAWCQIDGENPVLRYGLAGLDDGEDRDGGSGTWPPYIGTVKDLHTTTHHGITSYFARLTGLEPDTAYHFVVVDSLHENDHMTFKTAPAGPANISFIAGGDSRNHRDARQRANRTVALLQPHFVCFGGDMINRSTPKEWADWLDDWQMTKSSRGHMTPIIAARGNHEGKKDIHAFFDTPNEDDYYAVPVGDDFLRVYTLNSNITRAGSQGEWLAEDLATHGDNHWKVAHYHHPFRPHQSGKAEQNAQYNAWAPLFFEHGLNLAIECDSHVVKRTWPLRPSNEPGSDMGFIRDDKYGTTFIGEGCWGAPVRANNDDKDWTRASGGFNQVDWVCITPEKMVVRTILVDSIDKVTGTIDPAVPFRLPEGLEIWEPEGGAMVTISPRGEEDRPALSNDALARIKIVAEKSTFQSETEVRIEIEGEISDGAELRFTTDGSEPSADAKLYSAPFRISATTTVRAAIVRAGKTLSKSQSATFTRKGKK